MTGWQKSSYSANNGACVEWRTSSSCDGGACVQVAPGVLVRDSQLGEASPVLLFAADAWEAFTAGLKAA